MLERDIQTKILRYLKEKYPNAVIWKINDEKLSGIPDIIFMNYGRVCCFEVKNEKGRVSKIQEYTLKKLNNAGIPAFVVRSVEEVKDIL